MADQRGVYRKYIVKRTDGSHRKGGKHEHCNYFVLDLEHDPYAIPALKAYADACRAEYPELAADLDLVIRNKFELTPSATLGALMSNAEPDATTIALRNIRPSEKQNG